MPQSDDASHASPLTRRRRFAILAAVLALCASVAMAVPQLAAAVTNHSPIGRLDGAAFTDGALQVSGWAIDPDTTAPLQVHVYVDKQGWAITANLSRPDVGRVYPKSGSAHGFRTTRSIANGTHTVCAYAINVGAGSTVQLGCRKVVAANNPTGAVTSARRVAGGFQLSGYAIDPNTPAAITTHIYVDGHPIAQVRASAPNAAAAARYPHYGPNHGFSYLAVMSAGTHKVCVYGINVGVGSNTLLYCTTTTISFDPVGHLDSIKRVNASTMSLSGWLVDPDSNASISLRVTADGVVTGTAVANAARPDLRTSGVGVYGVAHGFGQNFSADANEHTVCVVGINVLAGADRTVGCADLPSQNAKPPAAPAGLQVWPDSKAATVNWSAPATNGAAVSGYRIVVSPGGKTYTYPASVLVATVPGLTNGITYTFSVTAMNLKGYGAAAKGTAKPTPIPPQRTPAPVSTSHYVRNLTANATT
ncbi:MAG TPA: fibronectin type III domain-containing protein, partial [Jatrophihabitans sp.]